ncbi:DoxX family protein [Paraburkholderia antibiotica]|uniref:DoxX family protein n=1 Tax=Paraburkholderia antibiotica TaxID=2728839 RepID=A0A7Y0A2E3_9BURK|nr:DoxX family protein [Paraburkholderia antibiotica]NML35245.1 DoxX family protein [Paraburkholderia antibiotica]
MRYTLFEQHKDSLLLISRVLMMVLFMLFGWNKLVGFSGTVAYMDSLGAPVPAFAAVVAVVMELVVGIAIVLGFYTRPLAFILALYTLGTAFIGHHFWSMAGAEQHNNMIHFYKNVSIFGGLLLLCVTGPGKYSIDRQ